VIFVFYTLLALEWCQALRHSMFIRSAVCVYTTNKV